jgi:hypothetical protein
VTGYNPPVGASVTGMDEIGAAVGATVVTGAWDVGTVVTGGVIVGVVVTGGFVVGHSGNAAASSWAQWETGGLRRGHRGDRWFRRGRTADRCSGNR